MVPDLYSTQYAHLCTSFLGYSMSSAFVWEGRRQGEKVQLLF